jgi:hypothetical protein
MASPLIKASLRGNLYYATTQVTRSQRRRLRGGKLI